MKLSKEQKKILKSIPNEKTRLEQKLQFKIQNRFFSRQPIIFVDGKLETDNPFHIDFLSQHPMCENKPLNLEPLQRIDLGNGATLFRRKWSLLDEPKEDSLKETKEFKKGFFYKGKVFDTIEEALEYAPMSETTLERIKEIHKNWIGLANIDFNIKGNEIILEEKTKGISLNNEYLQKVLSETHDVKFFRDLQNICVKCQNYEYASKFRQKVKDILDTLSTEKLTELLQNGTIDLWDMTRAIGCKKDKSANNVEKQFTLEDMRNCFKESRLTHLLIGFKHNTFEDYIESLKTT